MHLFTKVLLQTIHIEGLSWFLEFFCTKKNNYPLNYHVTKHEVELKKKSLFSFLYTFDKEKENKLSSKQKHSSFVRSIVLLLSDFYLHFIKNILKQVDGWVLDKKMYNPN